MDLLAVGISLDARLRGGVGDDPDEIRLKAAMWAQTLDADMPVEFAVDALRRHYANAESLVTPFSVNARWRTAARVLNPTKPDSHCLRVGCMCTHDAGCYRGWIDEAGTHRTTPCQVCRPETAVHIRGRAQQQPQRDPGAVPARAWADPPEPLIDWSEARRTDLVEGGS
jgi:hypothetical protein